MGTVHGVYLKYVGLSALSYAGYAFLARDEDGQRVAASESPRRIATPAGRPRRYHGCLSHRARLDYGLFGIAEWFNSSLVQAGTRYGTGG